MACVSKHQGNSIVNYVDNEPYLDTNVNARMDQNNKNIPIMSPCIFANRWHDGLKTIHDDPIYARFGEVSKRCSAWL
jgi:hypothetical protein